MFRPLSLFIGLRYARSRRRNHFVSFISAVSILGISLGVAALIAVVAVMNGFEREVRARVLGMVAHATITAPGGCVKQWRELAAAARRHSEVMGVAPFVNYGAMMVEGAKVTGVLVWGISPEEEASVSELSASMKEGQLDDLVAGQHRIILGKALAERLGIGVGEDLTLVSGAGKAAAGNALPRLTRWRIAGIFEVGLSQYDDGVALMALGDASELAGLGDAVNGIRLRVRDPYRAPAVVREVARALGVPTLVSDWTQQHRNFFIALAQQRELMFIILGLIIAVAAFNIVSTLVMVVTDKAAQIAILRTLGVSPARIMGIFMVHGTLLGLIGALLGVAAGVALALNLEAMVAALEAHLGIHFLAPGVYPISRLPSDLRWADVMHIGAAAFALSLAATLYPAWRAARTQPAQALRYE